MSGGDFVGLTATLNTFVFKIISNPEIKKPEMLKGKKVGISRWAAPAISPSAMR